MSQAQALIEFLIHQKPNQASRAVLAWVRAVCQHNGTTYAEWREIGRLLKGLYAGRNDHERDVRLAWASLDVKTRQRDLDIWAFLEPQSHAMEITVKPNPDEILEALSSKAGPAAAVELTMRKFEDPAKRAKLMSQAEHEQLMDGVYRQRNLLAIALARLALLHGWKAGYQEDQGGAQSVVYVEIPGDGQVSWHMDRELSADIKAWLPEYEGVWDGEYLGRTDHWPRLIPFCKISGPESAFVLDGDKLHINGAHLSDNIEAIIGEALGGVTFVNNGTISISNYTKTPK